MKDRKTLRRIMAGCCLITFLALTPSFVVDAHQVGVIHWAVRLYPDNPDYIEVYLDATELPTNLIAEKVDFTVRFLNEQQALIIVSATKTEKGSADFTEALA